MTFERVLALAILATASASLVLGNDLVVGSRLPNDRVIRNLTINRPPSERGLKLVIPIVDHSNISSINITDRNVANNQSAAIIFGGVGHRLAVVFLKSSPKQSLNFTLVARASRPPPPPPPTKPVPPHQRPPPPPPANERPQPPHRPPPPPPPPAHERPQPPHHPPPPPPPSSVESDQDVFEFVDQLF